MAQKPFLEIGEVVGTHGVAGELRVQPWCDSAADFCRLQTLYADEMGKTPVKVKSRPHKTIVLVKMDGVDTVQEAAQWRARVLYAARADLKLPQGRYFIQDLIGLAVRDAETDTLYGTVSGVSNFGAGDIYHMRPAADSGLAPDREVLIPAIPAIVRRVDIETGVFILPMEGLFEP